MGQLRVRACDSAMDMSTRVLSSTEEGAAINLVYSLIFDN